MVRRLRRSSPTPPASPSARPGRAQDERTVDLQGKPALNAFSFARLERPAPKSSTAILTPSDECLQGRAVGGVRHQHRLGEFEFQASRRQPGALRAASASATKSVAQLRQRHR